MQPAGIKIGVFDSGVGGKSVVRDIEANIPGSVVVFKSDRAHLPYGNKTAEQIISYMTPIIKEFENEGVELIVIACNTATTLALPELKKVSKLPVVGFVPAIKSAAKMTKTGVITVCATPGTLGSERYAQLKHDFASGLTVVEPDCSQWAELIEGDSMTDSELKQVVDTAMAENSDVIVLGCTHYHWIEKILLHLCPANIDVIQPTEAIIRQIKKELSLS